VICEPTGNATDEFKGTVRVFAEALLISTILFLSVNTSVYETDAVVVETSASFPRSIAALDERSALAIVPSAIIVLVTVPVSPVVITVPLVAGRVIVVVPAVAAGCSVTVPDVEPGRATLEIPVRARFAEERFSATWVVPIKCEAVAIAVAVMVPAVKLPEASRATIAEAVFASVAVVAEFRTFPDVEMVLNLLSAIEPESIVLVTVPESPVVMIVPVVAGIVRTVPVPTTAVGMSCTVPEVEPGRVTLEIPLSD
jgi:hypothetical protein